MVWSGDRLDTPPPQIATLQQVPCEACPAPDEKWGQIPSSLNGSVRFVRDSRTLSSLSLVIGGLLPLGPRTTAAATQNGDHSQ